AHPVTLSHIASPAKQVSPFAVRVWMRARPLSPDNMGDNERQVIQGRPDQLIPGQLLLAPLRTLVLTRNVFSFDSGACSPISSEKWSAQASRPAELSPAGSRSLLP